MTSPGSPALVSVVIPAYNAGKYVAAAVSSVLAQTYTPIEVIVVDDGSTDDTAEALEPFGTSITVIRQGNHGLYATRNLAVSRASGEFIAFLDADDAWHPEKVARQIAVFDARPDCVLTHTKTTYIDDAGRPVSMPHKPWHDSNAFDVFALLEHNFITASSVIVRRSALGQDPFHAGVRGCEDWDLWLRLSRVGPFAYLDEALTLYRFHESNMSANQGLMLESALAVLDNFQREERDAVVRAAARKQMRAASGALAHHLYESGRLQEARKFFVQGAPDMSAAGWKRLFVTSLPPALRDWAWARRHGT